MNRRRPARFKGSQFYLCTGPIQSEVEPRPHSYIAFYIWRTGLCFSAFPQKVIINFEDLVDMVLQRIVEGAPGFYVAHRLHASRDKYQVREFTHEEIHDFYTGEFMLRKFL